MQTVHSLRARGGGVRAAALFVQSFGADAVAGRLPRIVGDQALQLSLGALMLEVRIPGSAKSVRELGQAFEASSRRIGCGGAPDNGLLGKVAQLPRPAAKKKIRRREPADSAVIELNGPANAKNDRRPKRGQRPANRRESPERAEEYRRPGSVQGKRRARRNAYRHGLAAGVRQCGKYAAEIDALAVRDRRRRHRVCGCRARFGGS